MGALAVAGAGGFWLARSMRAWKSDYMTGTAETRIIRLEDGSRITLNASSAIDVDYRSALRRIVLIEGQAFFEVVPDTNRPFSVEMKGIAVTALGTAFDVDMNLPAGRTAVAVAEHSVRIDLDSRRLAPPAASDSIVIREGERILISADGRFEEPHKQDAAMVAAWRTGMYVAEDRRLDEVAAALSAYYDGWIVVRGDKVKALRVNAVLDLRTPDASLDALSGGLPIEVRRISRYLTVITAA